MLRRHGLITEWYDGDIDAGAEWREEITRQLEAADVILLLVSADFLASDFAYEEEMRRAIERANHDKATVIGVMLRPVDGWESSPFGKFQVLPQNGRPITRWSNADEAYRDVAVGIRRLLEERVRSDSLAEVAQVNEIPRAADLATNPAAGARGKEIVGSLFELLLRANGDDFIIVIGDSEANYYTQCFAEEGSFWCEAVSNEFLNESDALNADQTSLLASLGWNPPGTDRPNWWCVQQSVEDVAALMVRTLGDVYGVPLDSPLEIEASWAI